MNGLGWLQRLSPVSCVKGEPRMGKEYMMRGEEKSVFQVEKSISRLGNWTQSR
jgi:hypothetical protein